VEAHAATIFADLAAGKRVVERVSATGALRSFVVCARGPNERRAPLLPREHDVVRLLGRGCANKEMAFELRTSLSSIGRSIARASRTLGLESRIDLAILAAALRSGGCITGRARCRIVTLGAEPSAPALVVVSLSASTLWARLSPAERVVAELALLGHGGSVIARLRGERSPRTVANQLGSVFQKLGVSGRAELAARLVAG
jgi:DNA-binding NarL/FixJ family response regulator